MNIKTNVRAGRQNRSSKSSSSETETEVHVYVPPVSRCVGI